MLLSRYRPILFTCVVVAFVITAPVVLFFAFGYRYSFERGIFIFSGSITVKTLPESVDIMVDGEIIPKKSLGLLNNSIHIPGLMPGKHTLKISAPGYVTWEKQVVIESGVSREFWNITLPHTQYPNDTLGNTQFTEKIFPHPTESNRLALVKEQHQESSLVFLNYRTGETHQVFSLPESSFDQSAQENLEWSWFENGRFVILPLKKNDVLQHFVIDSTDGSYFSIEERLGAKKIIDVRWETVEPNHVLFLSNQVLYRFDITTNTVDSVSDHTLGYSLANDILYAIRDTGDIMRVESDQLTLMTNLPLLASSSAPFTFTAYDATHFALLEQTGEHRLFLVYPDPVSYELVIKHVADGIHSMQFSNDGKKLLYVSDNEINVIFTRDWDVQPRRVAGEIVQVARFSDALRNISWTEDYEHIVFSLGSAVKFIELDGRDYHVISDLQTLPAPPTQVFPLFSDNRLFFVTPNHDITSIVFPEPQGLFGQ